MKKLALIISLLLLSASLLPAENVVFTSQAERWLVAGPIELNLPAFHERPDVNHKAFAAHNFLEQLSVPTSSRIAKDELLFQKFDQKYYWEDLTPDNNGMLLFTKQNPGSNEIVVLANYIESDRFCVLNIEVSSASAYTLYLNHNKTGGRTTIADQTEAKPDKFEIKLEPGKHLLLIKSLLEADSSDRHEIMIKITGEEKYNGLKWSQSPAQKKTMKHVLEGKRVEGVTLSPDGRFSLLNYTETFPPEGKQDRWYEIIDNQSGRILHLISDQTLSQVGFHPEKTSISYVRDASNRKQLMLLDFMTKEEQPILQFSEKFGSYRWLPGGNRIIYNVRQEAEEKETGIRKLEGMPDRQPGWRSRSQLNLLDVETGFSQPITHGYISSNLADISPDGKRILIAQLVPDYANRIYWRQTLMEMDLLTHTIDTIFSTTLPVSATYSPDGNKLLVLGSPALFGNMGVTTSEDIIPNDTDTQGFILNLADKSVSAFTRDFNPKILNARWSRHDGKIYLLTEDRSYQGLQVFDPVRNTFTLLPAQVDVVASFSLATGAAALAYYGSSISAPDKALLMNTRTMTNKILSDPEKDVFADVIFGETAEWNYTTTTGQEVHGHIYYPPDFDPDRKYPLIVYYYAGINPINRSFRGRYPKNYFAAHGYVVYALTPSGSTGFGQEFAAMHVNNWGKTVAGEIIESTEGFLDAHPFIDREAVGCIGASYGGFMTMLLVTQTDMFTTAISHAGISTLSSYWGDGYWGYSYSAFATANSFPWNRKDIYVDQSPLFHADKVNTPLLLLHGNRDPNVPPGESIQMYTALKLLGKEVEYVEVIDQEHWILDYKKRLLWQKTIMSWFAKWLKNQPEWWDELYPDKSL